MLTTAIIFQLLTTNAVFATGGDTGGTPYNASRVKAPSVSATAATPAPTPSIAEKCLAAIQMCRLKEAKQDQCPDNGGEGCLTVRQSFAEFQCEGQVMDDARCEPTIAMVFGKEYIVHTQEMAACSKIAAERQLCQPEFDQPAFHAENGVFVILEDAERCLVSQLQTKPYQHSSEAQNCIAGIMEPYEPHSESIVAPIPEGSLTAPREISSSNHDSNQAKRKALRDQAASLLTSEMAILEDQNTLQLDAHDPLHCLEDKATCFPLLSSNCCEGTCVTVGILPIGICQ